MSWSLTIGRFGATTVRVHLTFFLLLAWIGVSAWQKGGLPRRAAACSSLRSSFTCVVLHEFGHILMARRFGMEQPEVMLLPIGGVALMPRMPQKPSQELAVAIAGPMVNIVIALLLFLVLGTIQPDDLTRIDDPRILLSCAARRRQRLPSCLQYDSRLPNGRRPCPARAPCHETWSSQSDACRSLYWAGLAHLRLAFSASLATPCSIFIAIFVYIAAGGEAQHVRLQRGSARAFRGRRHGDALQHDSNRSELGCCDRNAAYDRATRISGCRRFRKAGGPRRARGHTFSPEKPRPRSINLHFHARPGRDGATHYPARRSPCSIGCTDRKPRL